MTVRELIAQLQTLPPDLPVVVQMGRNEFANGKAVEIVETVNACRYRGNSELHSWYESDEISDDDIECKTVVNIRS